MIIRATLGVWLAAVVVSACSGSDTMLGTILESSGPATSFELDDQFGEPVALADYDGKVVALTFLYTYCPDICPVVAGHLKRTHQMLGDDADEVAFVAVSVDPVRDTVEEAYGYSEKWDMLHKWAFLVGEEEQLAPIWEAYYIDPAIDDRAQGDVLAEVDAGGSEHGSAGTLRRDIASEFLVSHSAPVYLIDRDGLMRVVFTLPFDPSDLAHDIRLLVSE